jgi:hypothetical protein
MWTPGFDDQVLFCTSTNHCHTSHFYTKIAVTTRHEVWSSMSVCLPVIFSLNSLFFQFSCAPTLTSLQIISLLVAHCWLPPSSELISWLLIPYFWFLNAPWLLLSILPSFHVSDLTMSECFPPWSRFLAYRHFVQGFEPLASVSVAAEFQRFYLCWLGNFLGNDLSIYSLPRNLLAVIPLQREHVWEPLPSKWPYSSHY